MVQNRNKLIELFVGNLSNSIVHEILERAVSFKWLVDKYDKEMLNSLVIAKKYREKINPVKSCLSYSDAIEIRVKIINKVRNELRLRISKGYDGIDLNLIEELVDKYLRDMKVIE